MQLPTASLVLLQLAGLTLAAPASSCESKYSTALACLAGDSADAYGTPFCSSYLSIPVKTATTTTTIKGSAGTVTKTKTKTVSPSVVTISSTISTSTVISTTITEHTSSTVTEQSTTEISTSSGLTCASTGGTLSSYTITGTPDEGSAGVMMRRAEPTPSCLTKKGPKTVSSICSCVAPTPSTSTVTVTRITTNVPSSTSYTTVTKTKATKTVTDFTTETSTITSSTTTTIEDPPTTTTVVTTNTIVQEYPVWSGLAYYAYQNNYDFSSYPNPTVEDFKNADYYETGLITDLETVRTYSGTYCQLPGQDPEDCGQLTLVMQGFFHAPIAGSYRFDQAGNTIDNYLAFFSDDVAYSDWDDNNANFISSRQGPNAQTQIGGTYTTPYLAEGEYIPVTFVYMNGGGPGAMQLHVTIPDGVNGFYNTTLSFISPCDNAPFVP